MVDTDTEKTGGHVTQYKMAPDGKVLTQVSASPLAKRFFIS
jgi:hypothetical protein